MSEATKANRPLPVLSSEGLGPNALTYARERVSLLGADEHMDTVNRALDALNDLPVAALLGGWTFKGFTAWAQGLESEIARLTAALKKANEQAEHFERAWYLRGDLLNALANAADDVGVKHFDSDCLPPEVEAMQDATSAARLDLGPNARLSGRQRP